MAKMRAQRANSFQITKAIIGLSALVASSTVFGAGFQIQEQNAAYLGTTYAGTAAWAKDASSAFYNPAALTHIKHKQLVLSGNLIWGRFDFEATRTNYPFALNPNSPIVGDQDDDPGGLALVPGMHLGARITDELVFGFSVSAPFGLKSDYDSSGVMRYIATTSELRTIDIVPSLAWRATDWLSVAAGPDFLFADAKLDVATNFGGPFAPVNQDGFQKNRARDWAFGWHAGFLVDVDEGTRFGMHYRSKFNVGAEGDSRNFVNLAVPPVAGNGYYTTRKLQSAVTLPETLVASLYYEVQPCLALVADVAWTRWSRFKDLTLKYSPARPFPGLDTITHEEWKNTWRVALGANYEYNSDWEFRMGVAWDESPVKPEFRTARIPDTDRIWLGFGVGYALADCLHVDAGYAHLFFKDGYLHDRGPHFVSTNMPALGFGAVEGNFSPAADIFGVQLRYDFV